MDEAQFQKTLREAVFKIIARDVGGPESLFRKTPHALEEFDVEYLTNEEAELLLALEGEKSLTRISQELGWSPLNVARVVFGLMTMDLVDRLNEDEV
jgi:DNA-binding MarR family transcriptional regulator